MYYGGVDGMRSGAATPRHSYDGHQRTTRAALTASRPGTPTSNQALAYPSYSNPPASVSGRSELDYDYEERDLGLHGQTRPATVQFTGSSRTGPHSYYSAPAPSNRGFSWDPNYGQHQMPYSPAPPDYPSRQNLASYGHNSLPGGHPDYSSEPARNINHDWYAEPPSSSHSSFGYFPVTAMSHEQDPALFGISAPHHHPGHHQSRQGEVLPSFPQWSRTWYDGHMSANGHAYTSVPPVTGQSAWESESASRHGAPPGSYGQVYGRASTTDFVKEERMRMLEREFGKPKVSHKGAKGEDVYEEDKDFEAEYGDEDLPLGSVTSTGKLVTERPKWNLAVRCLLGLVSVICCACGLGGALLVKTTSTNLPAPKGTLPAYLLYGCSVVTLLVLLYFYIFRACCCDPMRKELKDGLNPSNPLGGMIIPVLSGGGSGGKMPKQKRFGKKGLNGMQQQQQQAPVVNLIVDPTLLAAMGGRKRHDDDSDDDDERLPGDARRSSKRKHGLGVLGNMQMQRRWQLARKKVKLITTLDVVLCIAWIACDVVSLGVGKKCSSTSGAWCTFYNLAIASGVILVVLFLIAIYFDYRDLKVSKNTPKPPM